MHSQYGQVCTPENQITGLSLDLIVCLRSRLVIGVIGCRLFLVSISRLQIVANYRLDFQLGERDLRR
jgi:hypothetical protein